MDIVLAIAIFAFMAATAYLGVHVTLHPAETLTAKRTYRWRFAGLTVAAALLIAWQAYLNRQSQAELTAKLNRIQKNTETPPHVTVNVPPPTVIPSAQKANIQPLGPRLRIQRVYAPVIVDAGCVNAPSAVPANEVQCLNSIFIVPAKDGEPTRQTLNKYYEEFDREAMKEIVQKRRHVTLEPSAALWRTMFTKEMVDDEIEAALVSGSKVVLVTGLIIYTDDAGTHRTEWCRFLQPPASPDNPRWRFCGVHDSRIS